jgi:flavin-dependent dehydrogenase
MGLDLNLGLGLSNLGGGPKTYDVIIIGGGAAGASAAIYTVRADLRTLVIDKLCTHVKRAIIAAADEVVAAIAVDKYVHGRAKLQTDWR